MFPWRLFCKKHEISDWSRGRRGRFRESRWMKHVKRTLWIHYDRTIKYNLESVLVLPGWIHQCAAGRQTGPVSISTSQHAFCQNFSLTQHWAEPCLLPGAYTHTLVFAHQTRNIASLALHAVSVCLRQVLDVCPLPGMVVSPAEGVVPSCGQAMLKIHFNPDSVIKFDARVEVRSKE